MDARNAYRESAVRSANPVRLVVMLYEQIIQDLRGALSAIENNDVEARTREINHALLVIGQLQATLNLEKGGEAARNLDRFYSVVSASLLEAQFKVSPEILRKQIANVLTLREAWVEVERATSIAGSPQPPAARSADAPADRTAPADWKA
ncbi:MAG: flagellar export chaperone FliS [Acidobacteriia bacterium]|nr:flagellar export chaperone FliS [Terriglobia bacterium]